MTMSQEPPMSGTTIMVQQSLVQLWAGNESARQDLFRFAYNRLLSLVRNKFNDFPRLRDWEQSDDILQRVAARLHQSIDQLKPQSPREFFGLAALQIRWVLLDLAKKIDSGPQISPNMHSGTSIIHSREVASAHDDAGKASNHAAWMEIHALVQTLPAELREVVDLLYYGGLTQPEIASLLNVSLRTVKRRWREARLLLHEKFKNEGY